MLESKQEQFQREREELLRELRPRRFARRRFHLRPGGFFRPDGLPNLVAWFRYGEGITSSSGAVSQWADQSSNGRHLKQATGTNQPSLQSDGSILFDGSDNFLQTDAFTLDQPCTYYVLFKQIGFTTANRILDGAGAFCAIAQGASTPTLRLNAANNAAANAGLAIGTYGAVCGVFNGASSLLSVNSGSAATGDPGANNPGGLTVAANSSGNGNFCNAQYKEVIAYADAHSAEDRQQVIRYLSRVGGLGL